MAKRIPGVKSRRFTFPSAVSKGFDDDGQGADMSATPTTEDCIAWLERLVAFDTTSRLSNLDLIEDARTALEALGFATRLTHNEERTKANLWATVGPTDRGGIVLSGHTDVVPVDGQDWTSDPFRLDRRDGRLYGRGSADMKGFIACLMAHAPRMAEARLACPFHFALSFDEEVGCTGVHHMIADLENLPTPQAVIVGEPTSMGIVGGHKGGRGFELRITGVDGHSSDPDAGASAIFAAARIVTYLEEMQERFRAEADPGNGFTPPFTTVNVGRIEGGVAHNIIPLHCDVLVSFRNTPDVDLDAVTEPMISFIRDEVEPALKRVSPDAGVTITPGHDLPALAPDEGSTAERLLRHLTGQNASGRVSYGTEASRFQAVGVPAAVFGPGSIDQAHRPDEWIAESEIAKCNAFLMDLTDWARNNEAIG